MGIDIPNYWDTNAISPGTQFMNQIYEKLKIACQPVAINSGYVWPKSGRKISNRTITISIMQRINNDEVQAYIKGL